MPSNITSYSPDIIHSYPLLQDYLIGKEADERVKNQVLEATNHPFSSWRFNRNIVILSANILVRYITEIFTKAISYSLYAVCLRTWSYQLYLRASLIFNDSLLGEYEFGEDFLAPAVNSYSSDCIDLYLQPPILKAEIEDEQVRKLISKDILELGRNSGCCRGGALWFIRHYFKTKALFANTRDHIQALGSLFAWGSPPEAALLHRLCPDNSFVELVKGGSWHISDTKGAFKDHDEKCKKIADAFQKIAPGAYYLTVPCHGMVYICEEAGQGYLFDMNMGTIAINGEEGFKKLAERILSAQNLKDEFIERLKEKGAILNEDMLNLIVNVEKLKPGWVSVMTSIKVMLGKLNPFS